MKTILSRIRIKKDHGKDEARMGFGGEGKFKGYRKGIDRDLKHRDGHSTLPRFGGDKQEKP